MTDSYQKRLESCKQKIESKGFTYISGFKNWTTKAVLHHDTCNKDIEVYPYQFEVGMRCSHCSTLNKQSKGEMFVSKYLHKVGTTNYEYPKCAEDLWDVSPNRPLRYDFGFNYKGKYIVIEYQGEQHTNIYFYWSMYKKDLEKALDNFAIQNLHDDMKRQYVKDNNWIEIEVPFTCNTQQKVNDFLTKRLEVM